MKNKPSYSLESVDKALLLLQMLRDHGRLRVRQAATDLQIAPSTAHRLLAMLVYRDFARQDEDRCYVPGPGLSAAPAAGSITDRLRRRLLPAMRTLCEQVNETVNLMVRVGTQTRIVASVESTQLLHVGDRQGTVHPATHSSGGKALLAHLDAQDLAQLYLRPDNDDAPAALAPPEFARLRDELADVRQRGYAFNSEQTETGVCAIGQVVVGSSGEPVAAITISVPTLRFTTEHVARLVAALQHTTGIAQQSLAS
ncbi:MAG: IclR family transcriptional regulator [Pseudonocardia sp.]